MGAGPDPAGPDPRLAFSSSAPCATTWPRRCKRGLKGADERAAREVVEGLGKETAAATMRKVCRRGDQWTEMWDRKSAVSSI